MEILKDVVELLEYFGDSIEFETPVIVKMTPHSKPIILYKLSNKEELTQFDKNTLQTLYQRLSFLKHKLSQHEK